MLKIQKHNWIGAPMAELLFVLLVPFACSLALLLLPNSVLHNSLPASLWLALVVFVDVGHVYSTFYRTYADREKVKAQATLYLGLPVLLFVLGVLLHSVSPWLFWRAMAYLAVFHFVRQQYGFFKIYVRKNDFPGWKVKLDKLSIYAATLLPVAYWHFAANRNFNWFVKGDFFVSGGNPLLAQASQVLFYAMVGVYLLSEIYIASRQQSINLQKNAIFAGTALSWYLGIVYFNSDFAFTLLNVLCHGIPYIALVWVHGKKTASRPDAGLPAKLFKTYALPLFLLPLLAIAYFEEGLWDALVWKENADLFPLFNRVDLAPGRALLNLLVPLLSLPQLFHYVIDGFIWKLRHDTYNWTRILE